MTTSKNCINWKFSTSYLALLATISLVVAFTFWPEIANLVTIWETKEEYSHGFLIPVIAAFLVWQKSDQLRTTELNPSWAGIGFIVLGCILLFMGRAGAVFDLGQYGLIVVIFGTTLSLFGWSGIQLLWAPLFILVFMVPLPQFIYSDLSLNLQLVSSKLGVEVIRLFDISVFLEGNVIDLGVYKLQVVEACSGLRYLFPLMSLAFIAAYFFKVELWKRVVVVVSSVPITVLMNSFRIGVIGVLVDHWGIEQAEGFLHTFEGWVVFMGCLAILFLEMWLLTKFSRDKRPFQEVFGFDFPEGVDPERKQAFRQIPTQFTGAVLVLGLSLLLTNALENRERITPERLSFSGFPEEFNGWTGKSNQLESIYLDELKLDDYLLIDYANNLNKSVNVYMAYYSAQEAGSAAHSPKSCIPGGGWNMSPVDEIEIEGVKLKGEPLRVNRSIISKGESRQLVYYWFQQRGRDITNEISVRWYILLDSVLRNRTDGAMIRLTSSISLNEEVTAADKRLQEVAKEIANSMSDYIPE